MAQAVHSILLVRGHDIESRETVARFIERFGLKAGILHEQANRGETIIEKFEERARLQPPLRIGVPRLGRHG